jgi:hypothetical protein
MAVGGHAGLGSLASNPDATGALVKGGYTALAICDAPVEAVGEFHCNFKGAAEVEG